jgi:hypothetical protein
MFRRQSYAIITQRKLYTLMNSVARGICWLKCAAPSYRSAEGAL